MLRNGRKQTEQYCSGLAVLSPRLRVAALIWVILLTQTDAAAAAPPTVNTSPPISQPWDLSASGSLCASDSGCLTKDLFYNTSGLNFTSEREHVHACLALHMGHWGDEIIHSSLSLIKRPNH